MSGEVIPARLSFVSCAGATVSSLLYSVTAGGAPCDGLLFGDTITTTTTHLRDDDDTATVTESRGAVSSTLCCAASCSFYDEAGELAEPVLEELALQQPGPLLGWVSYRPLLPGSQLRPSLREAAVTQALLRRQLGRDGGLQAVLLLLVGSGADHNGATLTWQLRCFQARQSPSTGELLLQPVRLQTLNLGGHTGQRAYEELHSVAGITTSTAALGASSASTAVSTAAGRPGSMPDVGSRPTSASSGCAAVPAYPGSPAVGSPPAFGCGGVGGVGGSAQSVQTHVHPLLPSIDPAVLGAMAAGGRAQAAAVKHHCEALLVGLHDLCAQAVLGEAAVAALRSRRDALLAQLG